ncbi:MAG: hypothetical protein Q4E55_07740 [Bacteroidales bacterium]|nr:hypothetical protein [Bacteroidales bacterium]
MRVQDYMVAGIRFRLTMDSSRKAWDELSQYAPFTTAWADDVCFRLNVGEETFRKDETCVPVYCCDEESDEPLLNAYTCSRGWMFEMATTSRHPVCAHLIVASDFSEGCLYVDNPEFAQFSINNSLMLMYAFSTARRHILEMHASVVMKEGVGYLFLGKSGTGKSTHSRLWLKHVAHAELLNDDNPIVKVEADGSVRVYGSPWSGKTPCYRNTSARVGAFVQIRQAPENVIQRQSATEAFVSLYTSCSGMKWDGEMNDGLFDTLQQVMSQVPCYVLDCLPDEVAARLCSSTVETK